MGVRGGSERPALVPWETAPSLTGDTYRAAAHSVVVLFRDVGRGETAR
jgi:hypothetical protein